MLALLWIFLAHLVGYWSTVAVTVVDSKHQWDRRCAQIVLFNQLAFAPVAALQYYSFPYAPFESPAHGIWQVPAAVLLTDVLFYPLHRLMHTKLLFHVHRMHHEWKKPIGVSALYASPFEHIVVNMTPPLMAGILVRMNLVVFMFWAFAASANTVWSHAYENQHTDHHKLRTKNFGVGLMLMDRWMGTLQKKKGI